MACLPNSMGSVFADRQAPSVKQERIWGGNAMYNIYQTADQKFVVLGASEIHFAENLLRKFKRLDLLPLCAQPPGPSQEPVREFFCETFQGQSQDYWVQWFEDVDAAFAPVNSLRQGADNEQVRYRQMIVVDENGREHIGIPMKFLDEPGQVHFAAPELGQHNTEIARRLGYSESQIRQLQESGAFA